MKNKSLKLLSSILVLFPLLMSNSMAPHTFKSAKWGYDDFSINSIIYNENNLTYDISITNNGEYSMTNMEENFSDPLNIELKNGYSYDLISKDSYFISPKETKIINFDASTYTYYPFTSFSIDDIKSYSVEGFIFDNIEPYTYSLYSTYDKESDLTTFKVNYLFKKETKIKALVFESDEYVTSKELVLDEDKTKLNYQEYYDSFIFNGDVYKNFTNPKVTFISHNNVTSNSGNITFYVLSILFFVIVLPFILLVSLIILLIIKLSKRKKKSN